jgi:apolipoprotein N-acyltransferase
VTKIHRRAWLLTLVSAALQILIFPLPGLYWFSWVAVAPLLIALLRAQPSGPLQVDAGMRLAPATPLQGFLLAYVCGILWWVGTCYWIFDTMHRYGGLPVPAALLALMLFCLYVGLYHGLFGLLLSVIARSSERHALIAAPFLWVAVELARTRITAFPWELLGYAQTDNFVLTRFATLTGVYGLSWEIVLVNSAFAAAFLVTKERRKLLLVSAVGASVILQAGKWVAPPPSAPDRSALLVQQNIAIEADWTRDYFNSTLRELSTMSIKDSGGVLGSRSGTASTNKVDLIVWPESPAPFYANDPAFREVLGDLARQTHTWVVSGSIGIDSAGTGDAQKSKAFNSAVLVSPQGQFAGRYDKVHLVPFGEYLPFPSLFAFAGGLTKEVGEFTHGASRAPLDAGSERLGIFICYESVFPDEVRQFAQQGAQALVNISNDGWYGDSGAWKQHLQQTRMRAIENRRWILSATNTGLTAAIDPWGRVAAQAPRKARTALLVPYALLSSTTFYTRQGDWFVFLCAIISVGAILARFARKSQSVVGSQ